MFDYRVSGKYTTLCMNPEFSDCRPKCESVNLWGYDCVNRLLWGSLLNSSFVMTVYRLLKQTVMCHLSYYTSSNVLVGKINLRKARNAPKSNHFGTTVCCHLNESYSAIPSCLKFNTPEMKCSQILRVTDVTPLSEKHVSWKSFTPCFPVKMIENTITIHEAKHEFGYFSCLSQYSIA